MVAATLFSLFVGMVSLLLQFGDPLSILLLTFGSIIVLLLFVLLFNLKRFFKERFEELRRVFDDNTSRLETADRILIDFFGFSWRQNQYFARLQHFVDEKKLLAHVLVEQVLPRLVTQICEANADLCRINIILDSGTTITPVFSHLIGSGISVKPGVEVAILTNNLAGIDEIHKMDVTEKHALTERDFNLIGGRPLNKYRATTGELTQRMLEDIWHEQRELGSKITSVCVVTANWLLGGRGHDSVQICARGEGHFNFKVDIIKNSQYVVVVAPLGKMLPLDHVGPLNALITDKYEAYELPHEKRNTTYLLTSYRPRISLSPLFLLSRQYQFVHKQQATQNFVFCEENPTFDPEKSNRKQAIITELPHEYVRDSFEVIFGYPLSEEGSSPSCS
ncbi:MAG: hypothetical protein WBD64_12530 [Candidatus Zixiibacteriota bacterium]